MTYSQQNKKNLKRKHGQQNSIVENDEYNSINNEPKDSSRSLNDGENDSESPSIRPFWTAYCQVYDKLAESLSKVQTTEECIVTTRIADITSVKLAQEIEKLDLASIDHWATISSKLVRNWNNFFHVPENNGWSFGDLIPVNRYRTNYFGHKRYLLSKRKDSEGNKVVNDKKKRIVRKDENRAKLSKPLEGKTDDKPLPLIDHMKRVISAIENICVNGHSNVEYLRLLIDPNSFSSTVYNIFTISFMIRQDLVSLDTGKKGELLLRLKSVSNSQNKKDKRKSHFITCLDTSEWKELVKKLGITSAMVSCPNSGSEDDRFYERFSQSQKERVKKKKT